MYIITITITPCSKLAIQSNKICTFLYFFSQNEQEYFASYSKNCLTRADDEILYIILLVRS